MRCELHEKRKRPIWSNCLSELQGSNHEEGMDISGRIRGINGWHSPGRRNQAKSLAELLQLVKDGKVVNQRVNEQREREFIADKNRQQQAVRDAKREQANEEARSERLEAQFEKNEQDIAASKRFWLSALVRYASSSRTSTGVWGYAWRTRGFDCQRRASR